MADTAFVRPVAACILLVSWVSFLHAAIIPTPRGPTIRVVHDMFPTLKKWLTVAAAIFLIVIVVVVAEWQYTLRRRDPRLDAIRAKLDATEPGWRLKDMVESCNAKIPPTEINLADKVRDGYRVIPSEFVEWERTTRLSKYQTEYHRRLHPDEIVELDVAVNGIRPVLDHFRFARRFSTGGTRIVIEDPVPREITFDDDHTNYSPDPLDWAILLAANQGRGEEAIDLCRTHLHLSRAYGDDPIISARNRAISSIQRAARNVEITLGLTEPRSGLLELQAELTDALRLFRFDSHFKAYRALIDRMMQRVAEGRVDADQFYKAIGIGWLGQKTESHLTYVFVRRHVKSNHATLLAIVTEVENAMRKSGTKRMRALASLPFPPNKEFTQAFVFWIAESIEESCHERIADESRLLAMTVAIACERHRQRTGGWPVSLAEIPKEILPSTPNDPFADTSIMYRKCEKGIVVYSVGRNGVDEAGRNLEPNDDEESVVPGDDVGIFLFSPNYRAQPPRKRMVDNLD